MTKINYSNVKHIPVDAIKPNPFQTRKIDESSIGELVNDIRANGLLQPPQARRVEGTDGAGDTFELAYGHRRHAAFVYMMQFDPEHYSHMPIIETKLSDEEMAMLAWSENEVRKQLNPVERAEAVKRMIDQFEWTQQEVADKLRLDRSTVANLIRMLRMPAEVLDCVADGSLPQRAAMALLPWYELTPIEMAVIEQKHPEAAEFVAMARGGQIQSDVIRKEMEEFFRTSPALPVAGEESLSSEQASGEESPLDLAQKEELEEAIGDFIPEEEATSDEEDTSPSLPVSEEVKEEVKPTTPVTQEVVKATPGNVPPAAPAPAPEPPANTKRFTLTWYENGSVIAGYSAPGKTPVMKYFPTMTDDSIPDLLRSLREEVEGVNHE